MGVGVAGRLQEKHCSMDLFRKVLAGAFSSPCRPPFSMGLFYLSPHTSHPGCWVWDKLV